MKPVNFPVLVLIITAFTGCATTPPVDISHKNASWDIHRDRLSKLTTWQAMGRISVRIDKQAWSASLQWRQQRQEYFLRLIAPLGQGTYEITGNKAGVLLRTAKNEIYKARDPKSLMQGTFGWSVPLNGLKHWVRGLPEPGTRTEMMLLDEQGRLTDLVQSGWQVSFSAYNEAGGYDLPGRIVLQNDKMKVRLVIKRWKI